MKRISKIFQNLLITLSMVSCVNKTTYYINDNKKNKNISSNSLSRNTIKKDEIETFLEKKYENNAVIVNSLSKIDQTAVIKKEVYKIYTKKFPFYKNSKYDKIDEYNKTFGKKFVNHFEKNEKYNEAISKLKIVIVFSHKIRNKKSLNYKIPYETSQKILQLALELNIQNVVLMIFPSKKAFLKEIEDADIIVCSSHGSESSFTIGEETVKRNEIKLKKRPLVLLHGTCYSKGVTATDSSEVDEKLAVRRINNFSSLWLSNNASVYGAFKEENLYFFLEKFLKYKMTINDFIEYRKRILEELQNNNNNNTKLYEHIYLYDNISKTILSAVKINNSKDDRDIYIEEYLCNNDKIFLYYKKNKLYPTYSDVLIGEGNTDVSILFKKDL